MSGGQLYSRAVAQLVLKRPLRPYAFCDIQVALLAYLAGLENYRYLGSLLVHRTMSVGGLHDLQQRQNMAFPDPVYLLARPGKGVYKFDNNYYMPASDDLTPLARRIHEEAKRGRAA